MSFEPFDKYADEYDRWYEESPEAFEEELRVIRGMGMHGFGLSVGVGTGVFEPSLGVHVGVDPSVGMLRRAVGRGVDVVRALGENLPFRDGVFDFVFSSATFCFVSSPVGVVQEAYRVLGRGVFVVCLIPADSPLGLEYARKGRDGHRFYRFAKFLTVDELKRMLVVSGFSVVLTRGALFSGGVADFVCVKALK